MREEKTGPTVWPRVSSSLSLSLLRPAGVAGGRATGVRGAAGGWTGSGFAGVAGVAAAATRIDFSVPFVPFRPRTGTM